MNTDQHIIRHFFTPDKALVVNIAPFGLALAISAGLFAVLSGLGSRLGWWHFTTGFMILRWSTAAGLLAAIVSLIGGILSGREIRNTGVSIALAGFLIGGVVAGVPLTWMMIAEKMPRIHDITTDMSDPPQFASIMPLRKGAQNSLEYGGPDIAAQQRAAFPNIKPLVLPVPMNAAFDRALRTAHGMGWNIVAANEHEGRIEAMDRTFWFGFTDDIVVRISPLAGKSRIDVRSVSRVGLGDIGTNAKRVRQFLRRLDEAGAS